MIYDLFLEVGRAAPCKFIGGELKLCGHMDILKSYQRNQAQKLTGHVYQSEEKVWFPLIAPYSDGHLTLWSRAPTNLSPSPRTSTPNMASVSAVSVACSPVCSAVWRRLDWLFPVPDWFPTLDLASPLSYKWTLQLLPYSRRRLLQLSSASTGLFHSLVNADSVHFWNLFNLHSFCNEHVCI